MDYISSSFHSLIFKDVTFQYPSGNNLILDKVSFEIANNQRVGIIGDNGCGKSTLTKLILGIHAPLQGTVMMNDEPVEWEQNYAFLGYVGDPSYTSGQLGLPIDHTLTEILDIYEAILDYYGIPNEIRSTAQRLGLNPLMGQKVASLSTGQRKRLMITLSLGRPTDLLLLDEPLDGLDKDVRPVVEELLNSACDKGSSLLYIGHNPVEIDSYTDEVFELREGKLTKIPREWFQVVVRKLDMEQTFHEKFGQLQGRFQRLLQAQVDEKVVDEWQISMKKQEE